MDSKFPILENRKQYSTKVDWEYNNFTSEINFIHLNYQNIFLSSFSRKTLL